MAITIRAAKLLNKTVVPAGRKVQLQDIGDGSFQILKAETDNGEIKSTAPFVLFLKTGDFHISPPIDAVSLN